MIKFDELHHSLSNQKNVPIVGDMMASRWAYEALAVAQFRYNDYEKYFFEVNEDISRTSVYRSFMIPEMFSINNSLKYDSTNWENHERDFRILRNELTSLETIHGLRPFPYTDQITTESFSTTISERLGTYLKSSKEHFAEEYLKALNNRDQVYKKLVEKLGKDGFVQLEKKYHNEFLADLLMNRAHFDMVYRGEDQLIQKKDPIFMRPYSNIGRAHFYAPYKIIGEYEISTFHFNIAFIWFMTILLYLALLDNSLKKIITFFATRKKDENGSSKWKKVLETVRVIFSYPQIYRRALKIKKSGQV